MYPQPLPTDYPSNVEPIRREVLKLIDRDESTKLLSCRFKYRCQSIYCPLCQRQLSYGRKDALYQAAQGIAPRRLRFGTFKAKDVPLDALRESGKRIMQAGRAAFSLLGLNGYHLALEVSSENWSDVFHGHLHAALDTPAGGRGFLSHAEWQDAWLSSLPADLHPVDTTEAAHVRPIRDLEQTCYYGTKSPFAKVVAERESIARTVASIRTLKGLKRFSRAGTLAR